MIININNYEIEIRAKRTAFGADHNRRANKEDTLAVLCEVTTYALEAADRYEALGLDALAKRSRTIGRELYAVLDKKGYFGN